MLLGKVPHGATLENRTSYMEAKSILAGGDIAFLQAHGLMSRIE